MLNSFSRPQAKRTQASGFVAKSIFATVTASCTLGAVGIELAAGQAEHKFRLIGELPPSDTFTGTESQLLADGVYLFGEDPEPEQVGKAYMVFEVRRGRLIGAFYMPSSSFDCVFGNAQSERLDVTIVNSYERTTYPYSVPLLDLHPIDSFSANDRRILSTCTESYQQQVWNQ